MTKEQAIQIIEQALNAANMKGVYSLSDASSILQALSKINELVEIDQSTDDLENMLRCRYGESNRHWRKLV